MAGLEASRQAAQLARPLTTVLQPAARGEVAYRDTSDGTAADFGRYQALVRRATDVFGDPVIASRWLSTPSADFAGAVPLAIAREDEYSLERLEPVFARIEHGIDF